MDITIKDKNFDCSSLVKLVQGENFSETLNIILPLYYNEIDLTKLNYIIYGINEKNLRVLQCLNKNIQQDKIILKWNISKDFTAIFGKVKIILEGSNENDLIIKFLGGQINVEPDYSDKIFMPPQNELDVLLEEIIKETNKILYIKQNILEIYENAEKILEEIKIQHEKINSIVVHTPIIDNDKWMYWNEGKNKYIDSGKSSRGEKGEKEEPGNNGLKGDSGPIGLSPIKRKDYFTSEEIELIKNEIIEYTKQKTKIMKNYF